MVNLRHLEFDDKCRSLKYIPRGLRQLCSLQTLFYFVVGDQRRRRRSGGIGELHGLNQLRQKLVIRDLRNVRDARDAEEANLKDKTELQFLILDWGYPGEYRRRRRRRVSSLEEHVLDNLQPHQNLKELIIKRYEGVKMPRWMLHSSYSLHGLPNLVELTIHECHNLKCLPLVGEFPCLRLLRLSNLEALESICNKVVMTEGGIDNNNNNEGRGRDERKPLLMVLFPMLQQLLLSRMPNLEKWTISVEEEEEAFLSSMFPRLIDLEFRYCKNLTTVPMFSVEGIQHLTSLRTLKLECLDKLVYLPDYPAPATLEMLHIIECPSLVRLPDCFFNNLKLLSEFKILRCSELTFLPEGIRHLIALKRLKIGKCSSLSSLPQGIQQLTALIDLDISSCPGLKILPEGWGGLSSLEKFEIEDCSNLSSLPEGIQHLCSLKTLKLRTCPGLKALPDGLGSLPRLGYLDIESCSNLLSLPEGIQHLPALYQLAIDNCPCLRSLPGGLENLASRGLLYFSNCPNLSLS
ncbi:putative disease resistance protein RGA1 [Macadamia integrifolia]|uniref:putative disease resistance protein RGA1 n=1 Tax=Macadamia integrifolia TaxID=60698 RepID=UPI001C500036|nr:putative disease resistance protein RGA1 [Macadamia integrifolia]